MLLLFLVFSASAFGEKPSFPSLTVPDGLGYNIHFTYEKPGELKMLADSGAKIIRMDFFWSGTEREKGGYDFSPFEKLTDDLEKHGIRPLYILDYSNRHYDQGLSPYSPEGRTAFANWAAAAAMKFKGRGIIWEMYNEPNIQFWKPEPKPEDYIKLALETGEAIRKVAPDELYIGPATSEIDLVFLEKCFKAGLLEYWDAVSVHPYRQKDPETVMIEYAKLREMIDKYAPKGKKIPILSAEWGYSSVWGNYDPDLQGKLLPRQWMTNLACEVPISIWYDWHDDGTDPKEPEHNFGTVKYEYFKDRDPVYDPKPAYKAAQTFNTVFKGFRFNKRFRIQARHEDEHVIIMKKSTRTPPEYQLFLFDDGEDIRIAAWTLAREPQKIAIPCKEGEFEVIDHLGERLPDIVPKDGVFELELSGGPIYLIPKTKNTSLHQIKDVTSFPLVLASGKDGYRGKNVISRVASDMTEDYFIFQYFDMFSTDPISFNLSLISETEILIRIENPGGSPYKGKIDIFSPDDNFVEKDIEDAGIDVVFEQGEILFEKTIKVELNKKYGDWYRINAYLENVTESGIHGGAIYFLKFHDDFNKYDEKSFADSWRIYPDGDRNVGADVSLVWKDGKAVVNYRYDDGWKFACIAPKNEELRKIEGEPVSLGFWLDGDDSGNTVRIRFVDSKAQTFQPDGGKIIGRGPQYFEFRLDGKNTSHWGGPNDGIVHYPIKFDCIVIDGTRKATGPHTIRISSPVLNHAPKRFYVEWQLLERYRKMISKLDKM